MATINLTNNPSEIVTTDTNENILTFSGKEKLVNQDFYEVSIRVVSGTIKVNTMGDADSGTLLAVDDGLVVLTLSNNDKLRFMATTIGDTFRVYL